MLLSVFPTQFIFTVIIIFIISIIIVIIIIVIMMLLTMILATIGLIDSLRLLPSIYYAHNYEQLKLSIIMSIINHK